MIPPLVSVCIPTFNGAEFLREALSSVASQTYENIELIVSDDNSTDDTLSIIEDFKQTVEFPVTILHHDASGIGANWNNCVLHSNGKFIKFLFQDDVLSENAITEMVQLMETDADIGIVYSKRSFIFGNEKNDYDKWIKKYGVLHTHWDKLIVNNGVLNGKGYLRDRNLLNFPQNKIGEPTAVLIRTSCFEKVGYFNRELKQSLDMEFWLRVMKKFKIGFIDKPLVYFRLHEKQTTQINTKAGINDTRILPEIYLRTIFWYLHIEVKWRLLKEHKIIKKLF